jgi:hypothetical protein
MMVTPELIHILLVRGDESVPIDNVIGKLTGGAGLSALPCPVVNI